ncbi:MAG TPA: metallophosphoesterase [Vicinamibacterales bacterium]|jgi:calcineurin-like phosphoesterase family protein|nr:metallophosphoesterase [Vicinamibacterales bacterium]
MTTWLYADPHFGHAAIIRMCARPFAGVREMNATMAASWRAVVRPEDTVIVVGDFAHRMDPVALRNLFDSLPGRKHLVIGNHDDKHTRSLAWESQHELWHVSVDNQNLVLCHYPLLSWAKVRKGALQLYGHTHGRIPGNAQSADIGVDVMGWAPVRLAQIQAHMATLPLRADPEAGEDLENDDGGLTI